MRLSILKCAKADLNEIHRVVIKKYIFLVISGVICVSACVCDSDRRGSWRTQWALGWVFCQSWHGEVTSPVTMFN